MGVIKERILWVLRMLGRLLNAVVSFIVFCVLDVVDVILCYTYGVADFFIESEWQPCYCSSANGGGKAPVSDAGESNVVRLSCGSMQLEEISDTLYTRHSMVAELSKSPPAFTVNSRLVEMLQRRNGVPAPRWSDCDCKTCTLWTISSKQTLFVRLYGAGNAEEDVVLIHGFISSSAFWSETIYPNLSDKAKSKYRFFAADLLGFGLSPKPRDCLYTVKEHLERMEASVLEAYNVKSFHIVAHSLGCILALALAANHPSSVKSLTLLAPPYFPTPKGEEASQHTMRRVAPRRVWPMIGLGASIACWYEHISRTICLVICKNHRLWEFLAKLFTGNRVRTYLMEGFFAHTHNAAWHTLHNTLCGTAGKMEWYLERVRNDVKCDVTIYHGDKDEVIPVECSHDLQTRIPRAHVKVVEDKDHITVLVGRQQVFTRELEMIWMNAAAKTD